MKILIRPKAPVPTETVRITPATVTIRSRPLRVLDFDIENRPLSYLGSDFTTGEVTAIAWAWTDAPEDVTVHTFSDWRDLEGILRAFVAVYEQADMVTGHYILGHDLPMLNGALVECRLPALSDKMVHDTKVHFIRAKGISLSQESLGAMLRLEAGKVQMNQHKWRLANRLDPEGLKLVRERVTGDVRQHIEMRRELSALGYVTAPKLWKSGTAKTEAYTP